MLLAPWLETAKTPMLSKWMDEQILVHSYNVILLNNRKEQTTDTLNNVGEPPRRCAEELDTTKEYTLYSVNACEI